MTESGNFHFPAPANEPVRSYAPGSPERAAIQTTLKSMSGEIHDMPLVIEGVDVHTGDTLAAVMPHRHMHVLGHAHLAKAAHVTQAIAAANRAAQSWSRGEFSDHD